MAAVASDMITRGMNPIQASELTTQINGTSTGNTGKLIALGFSVPLANELTRQMIAGSGVGSSSVTNLMALGMPPALAKYCSDQILLTVPE